MSLSFTFTNNAGSTLAGPINNTTTTINLASGGGVLFPNPVVGSTQFAATIIDAATGLLREIVYCTSRSGDTLTVLRAQEGTVGLNWNAGDLVQELVTAGEMNAFLQTPVQVPSVYQTQFWINGVTGSDSNAGTQAAPFKTIQGGINNIANKYAVASVTVNIADGTYVAANVPPSAIGFWDFIGDNTNPSNVLLSASSSSVNYGYGFTLSDGVFARVSGMKFASYYSNLFVQSAYLLANKCVFTGPTGGDYCITASHGQIQVGGACTYSGNSLGIFLSNGTGKISIGYQLVDQPWLNCTMTLSGTPAFSIGCAVANTSGFLGLQSGSAVTGSATGPRYWSNANALIDVFGAGSSAFPGNSSGSTSQGGLYLS